VDGTAALGTPTPAPALPRGQPYTEERAERMRSLRLCNALATTLRCEFGPEARARRRRAVRLNS
jgi:hypothetical protein